MSRWKAALLTLVIAAAFGIGMLTGATGQRHADQPKYAPSVTSYNDGFVDGHCDATTTTAPEFAQCRANFNSN